MLVLISLIILGLVIFTALHDWLLTQATFKSRQRALKRIEQLISLQDWEKGEKELASLFAKNKGGKEAFLLEIQLLRCKGELEEALRKVEEKSPLFPEELLFKLEEAKILLSLARPQEALKAFQLSSPILRGESDLLALASALCQTGHPQECLDLLARLEGNQNGLFYEIKGEAYYALQCFSEAITCYQKALNLGLKQRYFFLQLGHAYRKAGNLVNAEALFRALLEKDREDVEATLGLGACLQEAGQNHKALLIYQSALALHPQELRLIHAAAYAALRTKKYYVAERYFFELLRGGLPDSNVLTYYGLCLEKQKKWQEAEQIYLQLVQRFPNHHQGYRALAWMFGVGLSQTLSLNQGLNFAHIALNFKKEPLCWEILSACMARGGHFEKAYQIQLTLAKQDQENEARMRRQHILRTLRKKNALGDMQVLHDAG